MSGEPTKLEPVPAPSESEPSGKLDEQLYRHRSSWPVTRGAALGMTLVLGLAVAGPALVHGLGLTAVAGAAAAGGAGDAGRAAGVRID